MNNLKEFRTKKGISQFKLAVDTGISPSIISRIENGWLWPYPGWRQRIAQALNVSESELFPEEGIKNGR